MLAQPKISQLNTQPRAGMNGVRMAWGSAQEATALFHTMNLFPHSSLEEAGLLYLQPEAVCAAWGFPPGERSRPALNSES